MYVTKRFTDLTTIILSHQIRCKVHELLYWGIGEVVSGYDQYSYFWNTSYFIHEKNELNCSAKKYFHFFRYKSVKARF